MIISSLKGFKKKRIYYQRFHTQAYFSLLYGNHDEIGFCNTQTSETGSFCSASEHRKNPFRSFPKN